MIRGKIPNASLLPSKENACVTVFSLPSVSITCNWKMLSQNYISLSFDDHSRLRFIFLARYLNVMNASLVVWGIPFRYIKRPIDMSTFYPTFIVYSHFHRFNIYYREGQCSVMFQIDHKDVGLWFLNQTKFDSKFVYIAFKKKECNKIFVSLIYLIWVESIIDCKFSLRGIANCAFFGLVTRATGHSRCPISTNENWPWSITASLYLCSE